MTFTSNEHQTRKGEIDAAHIHNLIRLEVAANLTKHARGIMTQVEGDLFSVLGRNHKTREAATTVLNALYKLRDSIQEDLAEAHRLCER